MFGLSVRFTLAFVLSFALGASGEPLDSSSHYEKGLSAYNTHDWATAIEELKLAYQLEPRREYLFALGQAQRLAGDFEAAIVTYRAFLHGSTNPQPRVEALVKRCEELLAEPRPDSKPAEPEQEATHQPGRDELVSVAPREPAFPAALGSTVAKPSETRVSTPVPARQWYQDAAGGTMLIVGLVAGGFGAAYLATDLTSSPPFWTALSHANVQGVLTAGSPSELVALGSIGGGALLVVGAILRYIVVSIAQPMVSPPSSATEPSFR